MTVFESSFVTFAWTNKLICWRVSLQLILETASQDRFLYTVHRSLNLHPLIVFTTRGFKNWHNFQIPSPLFDNGQKFSHKGHLELLDLSSKILYLKSEILKVGAVIYFVMSVCALNEWSMFLFQNISRKFGFWIHLEAGGILRLSSVYCTSLVNQEAAYQISDEQTLFICFYDPALSWGDILIWNVSCKCVVLFVNFVKF